MHSVPFLGTYRAVEDQVSRQALPADMDEPAVINANRGTDKGNRAAICPRFQRGLCNVWDCENGIYLQQTQQLRNWNKARLCQRLCPQQTLSVRPLFRLAQGQALPALGMARACLRCHSRWTGSWAALTLSFSSKSL